MNRYLLLGIAIFLAIMILATVSIALGIDFTGFFKAFDVTLSPGENYERNITVRMFYNVSVRFKKEGSSSYLSFTDNETVIVLKDASDAEILRRVGVVNGKIYEKMTNYELDSVATVSAYNISDYEDIVDQPVNDSTLSTIGTKAYITVTVSYGSASLSGYVIDDMTGDLLGGVTVAAFEDGANVTTSAPIKQNVSGISGMYFMQFDLSDNKAFDVYVDRYDVV